jgi:N-acetylmuramoyl-L-alanine amidase
VIQHDLVQSAVIKNKETIDRGVKQSMTYVLLGSRVPAVLVEMGFVSHEHEARLLNSRLYQEQLALGLYNGIVHALERVEMRVA